MKNVPPSVGLVYQQCRGRQVGVKLPGRGIQRMAKFGLFNTGAAKPANEYEGDYMKQNGEYVTIYRRSPNTSVLDDQVAAIRLDKGQSVKEIK
jgi:hypothetical protein